MSESAVTTRLRAVAAMTRPDQLALVVVVYLMGVARAAAAGSPPGRVTVVWGALALVPAAASVHLVNEYADVETDALTTRTRFSGGSGALVDSGLPRSLALRAAAGALALAVVATVAAVTVGSVPTTAAALVAVIVVFGWQYSVPPLALAWNGLGEVDNAALGGVVLPAYGVAVVADALTLVGIAPFLPLGVLVVGNLLATTWPDRAADAAVGKETLATRWSPARLRLVHRSTLALGFLGLLALTALGVVPLVVAGASILAAPLAVWAALRYTRDESPVPTVLTMVVFVAGQVVGWTYAAGWWGLPG